jgi:hypothetical protein
MAFGISENTLVKNNCSEYTIEPFEASTARDSLNHLVFRVGGYGEIADSIDFCV